MVYINLSVYHCHTMIKLNTFSSWKCTFNKFRKLTNLQRTMSTKLEPIKMSYKSYESEADGKKPPIIIMHSLFGCKSNWYSVSEGLHKMTRRQIIVVDIRNHGDSPHTAEQSYPLMAEDIKVLMKDLSIKKASLLGHSMGGRVMMYFAVVYPELVESLIPVDISPLYSEKTKFVRGIIDILRSIKLDINAPISIVRQLADEQMKKSIENPTIRKFLLDTNLIQEDKSYRWRLNLEAVHINFNKNLVMFPPVHCTGVQSMFHGPTYFIAGGNSKFLIPEHQEVIKESMFPLAKFEYIPGAEHWLHAEKPNEFLKLVSQFIATV